MKKRTGIIGLGTISKYYMDGIRESSILQLCAVCDLVKDAPSKECYKEYLFYTDYKEMIAKEQLDYVIISTPPATHNSIATYALENSVNNSARVANDLSFIKGYNLLESFEF